MSYMLFECKGKKRKGPFVATVSLSCDIRSLGRMPPTIRFIHKPLHQLLQHGKRLVKVSRERVNSNSDSSGL